mgnify:CR=1 FL=1
MKIFGFCGIILILFLVLLLSSCSVQKVGMRVEPRASISISTNKAIEWSDYYLPANYVLEERGLKPVIKVRTKMLSGDTWLTIDKGSISLKKEEKQYHFQMDFRDVLRNSWGSKKKIIVELDAGVPVFYNNKPTIELCFYVRPIVKSCVLDSPSVLKLDALKALTFRFTFFDKMLVDTLNSFALQSDDNTQGMLRATLLVKDTKSGEKVILCSKSLNSDGKIMVPIRRLKEVFQKVGEYDLYFYIGSNCFDEGHIARIKVVQ